ncbi:MAG: 16S rRNA (guanine(527)-N(7))-methyltransferase RsmG [Anaerolineae bacterium]|nr:16S rRNA (guanine(527)-N(7))-methyltransferase RsmG [Anaerolineae bacterium]
MSLPKLTQAIQSANPGLQVDAILQIAEKLERYGTLLLEWNQRYNLTAITDEDGITLRHFVDSLTVLNVLPTGPARLIDVGTGPGFPGIPLKIACPDLTVTLMDSVAKKVKFCDEVIRQLGLKGIRAEQGRAEEVAHQAAYREQFDAVTARAVAALPTLVEYLLPFVKVGGVCVAMKGSDAEAEAIQAENAIRTLGGKLNRLVPVVLPGLPDKRALIVIDKVAPTPPVYPRQGGMPRSSPLV